MDSLDFVFKNWEAIPNFFNLRRWRTRKISKEAFIPSQRKQKPKHTYIREIDAVRLYALIQGFIHSNPNGPFSAFGSEKPMDDLIWWDFVIESKVGYIHLIRSSSFLEAYFDVDLPEFDLESFLQFNLLFHDALISQTLSSYDEHILYINHFDSYKRITEFFWREIREVDISLPDSPDTMVIEGGQHKNLADEIQRFVSNAAKFHAFAKSLVLNSAFMIEAFINLLLHASLKREFVEDDYMLKKILKENFSEKIKSLHFYSLFFSKPFDLGSGHFQNVQKIMTLRNKYVHSEGFSDTNKIEAIYFDRDYPVFPLGKQPQLIKYFSQIFLIPDFETVERVYQGAFEFIDHMTDLVPDEYSKIFRSILESTPLSYNKTRKTFSILAAQNMMPLMSSTKKGDS